MIENNLASELNAKSIYLHHHEDLYLYALSLVQQLGCHRYSIGSDGHKLAHFRLGFDQLESLLEEYSISKEEVINYR